MFDQSRLRRLSAVLFILSLVMLVVHMESLVRFNRRVFHVHGNDDTGDIRMHIDPRDDSTSTWLKRNYVLDDGSEVDLIGQTIDGTLRNQSGENLRDWELRINIAGDCYINQAWNGEVEIHQYVGTDREAVQRINLQNYKLEDVTFDYRYDGDLLIPLQRGDYVIYYPSVRFGEMPIEGGDDVKIGVIFYYLDQLDLSDYDLQFHLHREFPQGFTFYALMALMALCLVSVIMTAADAVAYRRAMKEMELRKSGIFSMSDIYDLIYIIHLPTGEMTPVSVDEKIERDRPKNRTAKELLSDLAQRDVDEIFRDRMLDFVNTDTLPQRLETRNSVSIEFPSLQYGWCAIRFCAMDRVEGKPVENVVFTVENINEEKKEQEAVIRHIEEAESITEAKAAFMDDIAEDLLRPLEKLVALNTRILREGGDDALRNDARSAHSAASRLLMLTAGIVDGFGIESGRVKPEPRDYSLRQMMADVSRDARPMVEEKGFELTLDVAEALPDGLRGDERLLREALVNLVAASLPPEAGGSVQLAVYGKAVEAGVHLLFSVRVLSNSAQVHEPDRLGKNIVSALLNGMGSALRIVRAPAGHGEAYFEIEQPVTDAASA